MNRREMLDVVEAVLDSAGVPDAVAELTEERNAFVRFGQNRITQNMDIFERKLRVTLGDGSRRSVYTTHRVDVDAIPEALEKALSMLRSALPDPEYMPAVESGQLYPIVDAFDSETEGLGADARTRAAASAIAEAERHGMEASGLVGNSFSSAAIGTSTGNLAYHASTGAHIRLTMDRDRASSFRYLGSEAWSDLPLEETIARVAAEAEADTRQRKLEPGMYRLILEPQAVADLVPFLAWSMNARPADEGLTVFSGRSGDKVTGESFTMRSEVDGLLKGHPFDEEGLAAQDAVWIECGRLVNQPCTRYWAKKTGREPLFIPGTLAIDGGAGSTDELLRDVRGRALLFRRFWYIRFVDQKELSLTGMTRDGVFLVEDGDIVHPVGDFRWNWKPLDLFSKIEVLGEPERKGSLSAPPVVTAPVEL